MNQISPVQTLIIRSLYIFSLIYFFIAIGSTTDRMLFFEESIQLPFLNIQMNLLAFYWLMPVLFLMSHFYYLLDLSLARSKEIKKVFSIVWVHKIYYNCLIYIFPILVFVFFQIRFSKYQDGFITTFHFILIYLDIFLVYTFLPLINSRKDSFLSFKRFHIKMGFFRVINLPFFFLVLFLSSYNYYLSISIIQTKGEREAEYYTLDNALVVLNPIFYHKSEEHSFLFPNLDLPNQNLLADKTKSYSKRSFKYANFNGSILDMNLFNRAYLENASFQGAVWSR